MTITSSSSLIEDVVRRTFAYGLIINITSILIAFPHTGQVPYFNCMVLSFNIIDSSQ